MVRESTSGRQDCGISDGRRSTARATAGFETFPGKEEISGGTETIREDCPDCSRDFRSIEIESELDAPCSQTDWATSMSVSWALGDSEIIHMPDLSVTGQLELGNFTSPVSAIT